LAKGFIHGCETALGNWHESIAKIIAKENFKIAKKLQGTEKLERKITNDAQRTFENILSDLDSVKREPNHKKESEEIYLPILNFLSIGEFMSEFNELCFQYIDEKQYKKNMAGRRCIFYRWKIQRSEPPSNV